jgi:hypothetical protein
MVMIEDCDDVLWIVGKFERRQRQRAKSYEAIGDPRAQKALFSADFARGVLERFAWMRSQLVQSQLKRWEMSAADALRPGQSLLAPEASIDGASPIVSTERPISAVV